MYVALYRSCRPETFSEILGQEHIIRILKNQVATGSVSHAYLFCGTRGTGKTTTARVLAKAVNCLSEGERPCGTCANCRAIKKGSFMDVIEIDAASNNGVENVRELRESVKYPPAVGRKKVYIIDEVHMLSPGAYNALLKTLEEPPEYVTFILATTEPQKLPATILSRCMRLDFRRVPQKTIAQNMQAICRERGVEITEDAVRLLAGCADGSVRDGLSILDQVLAGGDKIIDRDKALEYVGTSGEEFFITLTELVTAGQAAEALVLLNDALQEGKDVRQVMKDWAGHYRNLLIAKFVKDAGDMLSTSAENLEKIKRQGAQLDVSQIDAAITRLSRTINDARWSTNPRVLLELAIVAIAGGGAAAAPASPAVPVSKATAAARPACPATTAAPAPQTVSPAADAAKQYAQPQASAAPPDVSSPSAAGSQAGTNSQVAADSRAVAPTDDAGSLSAAKQASEGSLSATERETLWREVFEDGDAAAGSFNLIRNGATLEAVGKDSFTVAAVSSFTKKFIEQKRAELERLMERRLGRHLKLICVVAGSRSEAAASGGERNGERNDERDGEVEKLADQARQILGIDVDIE